MEFDPISFLLGFGSASGMSYGLWRYRERIRRLRESAEGQAESAREYLKRSADARYIQDLIDYLETHHLAGTLASLSEILIEPRLLSAYTLPGELHDDFPEDFTYVIPRVHDFPELYAAYNLEHMPLTDLCAGDRHVAILGNPGMGKSTALAALALMSLEAISFETMQTLSDQALEKQYEGLSAEEIEQRKAELKEIEERALEQLHEVHKREGTEGVVRQRAVQPQELFPIFVHIGDIDLDLNIYGIEVDPAEPLIRAFQQYVSLLTAQSAPTLMYQNLAQGVALVMIDGFDDLSMEERTRVYPWLESFVAAYGQNRIIITGPATGYDPLLHLGFVPTFIRPWHQLDAEQFVRRMIELWPTIESRKAGKKKIQTKGVGQKVARRLMVDNRNRSPLETTLKVISGLSGSEKELGRRGWFERYTRDFLPDEEYSHPVLREVAMVMLDRGVTLKDEQISEIATKQLTVSEDEGSTANVDSFLRKLLNSGLLVKRAGNTYTFRHSFIKAYFGAESLIQDMPQRIGDVGANQNWHYALALAASVLDLTPAVHPKLSVPPDLLFSSLFDVVDWLVDTPPNVRWRGEILKRLSGALLAPSQYTALRERAAAALVASRDPNVQTMFRQAVRSGNSTIRKLACVGLGAIGATDALRDLQPMLADDSREVQLASAMALGAIGIEDAMKIMIQGLLQGDEPLRRVVAEALAGIPGEGQNILRDAIEHQDMMVRRAAVFGLARIQASWAVTAIYTTMLEDSQWYVRSAAGNAFTVAHDPDRAGPQIPPPPEQLPWLVEWATEIGQSVPAGNQALQLVIRALQEAEPSIRMMAAEALGRLGAVSAVKPLYSALTDRDARVRTIAYRALGMLQVRVTKPLPSIA